MKGKERIELLFELLAGAPDEDSNKAKNWEEEE